MHKCQCATHKPLTVNIVDSARVSLIPSAWSWSVKSEIQDKTQTLK